MNYNKTVNDVKLKMQMDALTLKLSENINKINDLIEVDKNIKKDIVDNLNLINSNKENISKNDNKIYKKGLLITSNKNSIYGYKKRLDVIEEDIKNIPLNSTEIIGVKNNLFNIENTIENHNTDIIKISNIENDIVTIRLNIKDIPNMKTSLDNVKNRQSAINIILEKNSTNINNNYNISQINKKKSEFNTDLIDNHTDTLKSIRNDIDSYYKLKDIIVFDIVKTTISENIDINNPQFVIIHFNLNNAFKKDSFLEFKSSILIFFNKHYINIGFFHLLLKYYNDENVLFESIKMPLASGTVAKFCNITNSCIIKIPNDFEKIYFKLSIKSNDKQNRDDSISILDFDNKIDFRYYKNDLLYNVQIE